MKKMKTEELNTLYEWMNFIVNTKEACLDSTDCSLNIFGEGDDAYLVINLYESDTEAFEYYFRPAASKNGLNALISALNEVGFSVQRLLDVLTTSRFANEEMGETMDIAEIKVYREHVKSN